MADSRHLVSRRRVVVGIGGAALAAAASGAPPPTKPAPGAEADVIIIGGGFSGIAAARDCRRYGLRATILEARNRLGGRTFSSHLGPDHVELGGSWVHWSQPFVWSELTRYGLTLEESPQADAGDVVLLVDGKRERLPYHRIADEWDDAFNKYFAEARLVWPRPFDGDYAWTELAKVDTRSALDQLNALKLTPRQRALMTGQLESMSHGPLAQSSYTEMLRWYALPGYGAAALADSTGRYLIVEGTGTLLEKMVHEAAAEVHLSTVVRRVEQNAAGVVVTTTRGERYAGRAVILALPMNVLDQIEYAPELSPVKLAAARERHSGVGCKCLFRVKGKLDDVMLLAPGGYGIGYAGIYRRPTADSTMMVAFGVDPKGLDVNDEESVQASLRQFLPEAEVEACVGYAWTADPYSRGTWCDYRPGGVTRYWHALRADEGLVYMAGSDTADGWRGFIDGAIGAGVSAAHRVATKLLA
jgi:monoamine oxidase